MIEKFVRPVTRDRAVIRELNFEETKSVSGASVCAGNVDTLDKAGGPSDWNVVQDGQ